MNSRFDIRTFMKDILELDENYIDEIFDYYKESLMCYILGSNQSEISEYTSKLIRLYNDTIKIDSHGFEEPVHEQIQDQKNNLFRKDITKKVGYEFIPVENYKGIIIYSILQYEEDSRIEKYDDIYNFENFNYRNFFKKINDEIKNNEQQYSIIKDGKIIRRKEQKPHIKLNIKDLIYDYYNKGHKVIICLAEWEGNYIAVKLKISNDSPFVEKSVDFFQNNPTINIINCSLVSTLNNSRLLLLHEHQWKLSC